MVNLEIVYVLVRLAKQTLKAQQNSLDVVSSSPLVLENVQADAAGEVDIRMIDGCLKEHRRSGVRIVGGELKAELEGQPSVGSIVRTLDGGSPSEEVSIRTGEGRDAGSGRRHELHQLGLQSVWSQHP